MALLSITAAAVGLDFSSATAVVFVELPSEVRHASHQSSNNFNNQLSITRSLQQSTKHHTITSTSSKA